ncbi:MULTISPECIES: hypothetical protein [unclassified Streptomyces]|uniref:hypothetical protein n=1 Tax=unclassified Streptomyces TaxID=2593676 RepID=UPI0003A60B29|nr:MULTISPECIES: hypothetical protein [unclassified Streptomyces]MYT27738.1 hypothetical protein [Streptomyces sp. SID8354]
MRKYIGRTLAAAALAAATVVPAAGMAQAAPQGQTVAMSGDHGRGHHGRWHHRHRDDDCGFGDFGRFGNEGRFGHEGREGHHGRGHFGREGCERHEDIGLLGRILRSLLGWLI